MRTKLPKPKSPVLPQIVQKASHPPVTIYTPGCKHFQEIASTITYISDINKTDKNCVIWQPMGQ